MTIEVAKLPMLSPLCRVHDGDHSEVALQACILALEDFVVFGTFCSPIYALAFEKNPLWTEP